jgi:hypothetical protein
LADLWVLMGAGLVELKVGLRAEQTVCVLVAMKVLSMAEMMAEQTVRVLVAMKVLSMAEMMVS